MFYIWSHEHRMWWRPTWNGYTSKLSEAGLYDASEAMGIHVNGVPHGIEVVVPAVVAERHGTDVVYRADPW